MTGFWGGFGEARDASADYAAFSSACAPHRTLGKGEVESSILSRGTRKQRDFSRRHARNCAEHVRTLRERPKGSREESGEFVPLRRHYSHGSPIGRNIVERIGDE